MDPAAEDAGGCRVMVDVVAPYGADASPAERAPAPADLVEDVLGTRF